VEARGERIRGPRRHAVLWLSWRIDPPPHTTGDPRRGYGDGWFMKETQCSVHPSFIDHKWEFRTRFAAMDRLFIAFDHGPDILYETLWGRPPTLTPRRGTPR